MKIIKENTAVFVVSHKEENVKIDIPGYYYIQAGADRGHINGFDFYDDEGENISSKNLNYCELTAQYWMWKHLPPKTEYVGLNHYRRFFTQPINIIRNEKVLTIIDINKIMREYDVILPLPTKWNHTVEEIFYDYGCGYKKDLELIREIIAEKHPRYVIAYDQICTQKQASYFNMFIMRNNNFDLYCKWLFDILGTLETKLDISTYNKQEARIYGYLSEILLNVWIRKEKLSIKYCDVLYTELPLKKQIRKSIATRLKRYT